MIDKLQQLHNNDPKAYWKLLEDLKTDDSTCVDPQISADDWTEHFSGLNDINQSFMQRTDDILTLLNKQENIKEFNELDFKITPDELHAAATSLKNNKDGDVPRRASYGVYISQLIRFARVCNHVTDFNARNKCKRQNFSNRAIGIINFEKHFLNFIVDTMN